MENQENNYYFKASLKKDLTKMKEFHKYLSIFKNEQKIQIIDFIHFLEILPLCFSATNIRSVEDKNRFSSFIFCTKCFNLKNFKTIVNIGSNYDEINLLETCTNLSK